MIQLTQAEYDKLLAYEKEEQRLRDIIAEVHSWAVCAAVASPEDMAQNFPRIAEITAPDYGESFLLKG
jgi:hypothetical protein